MQEVCVCSLEELNLSLWLLPMLFCPELKNQEPGAAQKSGAWLLPQKRSGVGSVPGCLPRTPCSELVFSEKTEVKCFSREFVKFCLM